LRWRPGAARARPSRVTAFRLARHCTSNRMVGRAGLEPAAR